MGVNTSGAAAYWNLERYAERVAFVDEQGGICRYGQLQSQVDEFRDQLPQKRQLMVMVSRQTVPSLVAYLGLLQAGHPFLLLDEKTPAEQRADFIERFRPARLIDATGQTIESTLLDSGLDENPTALVEDLALLLPTSGSSGVAKWVMLSYDNLQSNAASICEYQAIVPEDRAITSLPMAYSYGLSVINTHLLAGASLALSSASMMERPFWEQLREQSVTHLAAVPFQYELMERLRFRQQDWPALRLLTQAGGRLSETLAKAYTRYACEQGKQFFLMYGQTEATARMAYLAAHREPEKVPAIGRAIPGGQILLADTEGELVTQAGQPGEIRYRGPNVMLGYARTAQDLVAPERPQELATGDLAVLDESGVYRVTGRLSRILKMQGRRIDLDDLQHTLAAEGWSLLVTGEDDRLLVCLTPGQNSEALLQSLAGHTGIHRAYCHVFERDAFPLTPNGKPDYAQLKRMQHESAA